MPGAQVSAFFLRAKPEGVVVEYYEPRGKKKPFVDAKPPVKTFKELLANGKALRRKYGPHPVMTTSSLMWPADEGVTDKKVLKLCQRFW